MIALFIVLGLLLLIVFLGGLYAYMQAFYAKGSKENINGYFKNNKSFQDAKESIKEMMNEIECLPSEDVYIRAYDGIKLYGRYYHIKDGAPVEIQMHGYKGNPLRDFCGGHKLARKQGHNVLLIDQRGGGNSEGNTISFGVKERHDALSWARYIYSRFGDVPIFLVGVSMGGATVLMASDMELPRSVAGIIADCPYTSPTAIIKKVCKDRGMPRFIYPFVTLGALIYGHFYPDRQSAVRSIKNARVPILILHGEDDSFVPCQMAKDIYDSCTGEKYLYTFKSADHGMSYMADPERYEQAVMDFTEKCLNSGK